MGGGRCAVALSSTISWAFSNWLMMMSPLPPALSLSYRPDGGQLAVATLNGEISIWDPKAAKQTGSINGTYDLEAGRKDTDKVTAKQLAKAK